MEEKQEQAPTNEEIKKEIIKDHPIETDLVDSNEKNTDAKSIFITLLAIVGLFALIFSGSQLFEKFFGDEVETLVDLHQKNLKGELDPEQGYIYNGFSVVWADGLWWTEVTVNGQLTAVPLHFDPKSLEDIPVTGFLHNETGDSPTWYIAYETDVYDKYYNLAASEFVHNAAQGLNAPIEAACKQEADFCVGREILSCDNAHGKSVIEFVPDSSKTSVEFSQRCIQIVGNGEDLVRASNRLVYELYGVMKR